MMAFDRGELVEAVRRYLRRRGLVLDLADEVVDVIGDELRRQHGRRVRAGLVRARCGGGGRVGRPRALTGGERVRLEADAAAGVTQGELARRYGLSQSSVGRYLRGEV
jgi:hypothetical protein